MWNLIGWCTIGTPQGGMAKCPEPSLVTRLADKGRTWGIGPILFAQGMVQSPSGPCKEMLGLFSLLGPSLSDLITGFFMCLTPHGWIILLFKGRLDVYWRLLACRACKQQLCSLINQQNGGTQRPRNWERGIVGKMYLKGAWLLLKFQSKLIYFSKHLFPSLSYSLFKLPLDSCSSIHSLSS